MSRINSTSKISVLSPTFIRIVEIREHILSSNVDNLIAIVEVVSPFETYAKAMSMNRFVVLNVPQFFTCLTNNERVNLLTKKVKYYY